MCPLVRGDASVGGLTTVTWGDTPQPPGEAGAGEAAAGSGRRAVVGSGVGTPVAKRISDVVSTTAAGP